MQIKEFVKTVLTEISNAVEEAGNDKHSFTIHWGKDHGVSFDLAVVATSTAEGKMGAEIIGIGGKVQGTMSHETINRIQFKVLPEKVGGGIASFAIG